MKKIIQFGNPMLRKKAKDVPIKDIRGAKIKRLVKEMKETLRNEPDGVGLAAPQIGVSLRVFIVSGKVLKKKGETKRARDMVFINPTIVRRSRKKELVGEGCLSVRRKYGKVKRSSQVTINALGERGERITSGASGLLAQIFQHEIDHLDGILFVDKADEVTTAEEKTSNEQRP